MRFVSLPRRSAPGFTVLELLLFVAAGLFVCLGALQEFTTARDRVRESETRAGMRTIQVALERYYADHEEYPPFLLGGDLEGWAAFHEQYDEPSPNMWGSWNAWLNDPLLIGGYLTSYPSNPFVDDGSAVMTQTGGDVRFGSRGDLMANGLDDPRLYNPYWESEWEQSQQIASARTVRLPLKIPLDSKEWDGYAMGGRRVEREGALSHVTTHWPGAFAYRGVQKICFPRKGYYSYTPWLWYQGWVHGYFLGVYGGFNTAGMDLIRLEDSDPSGQSLCYRLPPPIGYDDGTWLGWGNPNWLTSRTNRGGLPECMGGGDAWTGPTFPYDSHWTLGFRDAFLYGAPDGAPDGLMDFSFPNQVHPESSALISFYGASYYGESYPY